MIKNFLKTAFRNLYHNKAITAINIVGLSLGFACVMLILLYVNDETSFDKFHKNARELYRVVAVLSGNNDTKKISRQGLPVGPALEKEIAGVQHTIRSKKADAIVQLNKEVVHETIYYCDKEFFSVFSFPLLHGNATSVLNEINSVVLTKEMALKFFGTTEVVGKTLSMKLDSVFENAIVTGVAENAPQNSSIQFDFILPIARYEKTPAGSNTNWMSFNVNTFVLLQPNADPGKIEARLPALVDKYLGKRLSEMNKRTGNSSSLMYSLQNIKDIHLDTSFTDSGGNIKASDPLYSYILMGIAIFILVISCINFVNLSIGLSFKRAKEIGIRKVVGGKRIQLILQFISESFLLCLVSFLLSIMLVQICLPLFNQVSNKQLALSYLYDNPIIISSCIALLLTTGLVAGSYPALIVSRFKPVETLYSKLRPTGKNIISKYLIVFQFGLTVFLVTATIIFQSQFNLLTTKDLGYNDKNIVQVQLPGQESNFAEVFKSELLKNRSILDVVNRSEGLYIDGAQANGKDIGTAIKRIDENYLSVLQIPVLKGRNFGLTFSADTEDAVIVNEAFAKEIGWDDPVGKQISLGDSKKATIVGMVKDYHFQSLREKIMPLVLHCGFKSQMLDETLIKIESHDIPQTLKYIEETFKKLSLFHPFQYNFSEQLNTSEYAAEQQWKQIISYATVVSIFISCLGLFGLTTLSIVRRTKEIGIRKVLGASTGGITLLVLKDFVKLILMAFIISIPFAWYSAHQWLENFAYRINIEWWIFGMAGFITVSIAFLTVSLQAIKAAIADPVKSLRTE